MPDSSMNKRWFFLFFLVALLNGCGYKLHGHVSLPFSEVAIDTIENRTLEPGLQDILHRALTEEFMRQGIAVNPSAKHRISAVIRHFDMPSLSEKGGISREYRIIVGVDFVFTDEKGERSYFKNLGSPFMTPFSGSDDLGRLLAAKRIGEEEALRDVAAQLSGALIYK